MFLPGSLGLGPWHSDSPLLLLKTDTQSRRKERERPTGGLALSSAQLSSARGALPARCQPGRAAHWDSDPIPSELTLPFTARGRGTETWTPDLLQFFLKIGRWEEENDQRWRCPKAAALNWRVEGVAQTPTRGWGGGSPGPLRRRSVLPVFSLISHRTLKSAGFIR